ncbi:hypothetical protein FSP39_004382 [Pinctada imbricata]|uniref:HORMA domain-containing protein n=1 Tax=Pinctada imbricata TaxID=66713 RepID=A0AA89BWV1_PINIB|nr:hypothetical protein FSP39_004382 [Pinctada imbricata]
MDFDETQSFGLDILLEFLEVAIHCILHKRDLYPKGVFRQAKKYGVPVQMCIHPDVSQYIKDILESIKRLPKNSAEQVCLVIMDKDSSPVERFVFKLATSSLVSQGDRFLYDLEQSLRSFLLKLNVCDSLLSHVTAQCSWTVHVTTKQSSAEKMNMTQLDRGFPWVEAEGSEVNFDEFCVVPIRSLRSHFFDIQLFVQEKST